MMQARQATSLRGGSKSTTSSPAKKPKTKSGSKKQSSADTPGSATKSKLSKKGEGASERRSMLSRQTRIEQAKEASHDDGVREELNEQLRANEQLRSENHQLRIDIVSLESKLRMSQQEHLSVSRQLQTLADQKNSLETNYLFKLKQSQKQSEMLEEHVRSLKSEVLEAEKGLLMRERENLQGQEDATKRFDDMLLLKDREIERLKKTLTESMHHSNNVAQELSRLRVFVERCKRRESEMQEAVASAHREIDSLRSSLTSYEHYHPLYPSASGREECKIAVLEQTLHSLRKELKGAIVAKETAMEAHENEKEEKQILLDAYDKLRTDLETSQVEWRSQSEEDKAAIGYLEKELTHMRHVHNMLQRDRQELESALSEHQKRELRYEEMSQEIGEHREKTLLAQQECAELREQIELLQNELTCSLSQSQQQVGKELHMKKEVEKIVMYLTREMECSSHQKLVLQKHLNVLACDLDACTELVRELQSSWSRLQAQPERAEVAVKAVQAGDMFIRSDLEKEALQEQVWKLRGRLDAEETFRRELTDRLPLQDLELSRRNGGLDKSLQMEMTGQAGAEDQQSDAADLSGLLGFEHSTQATQGVGEDQGRGDRTDAMERELEEYKARVSNSHNASVENLFRYFDLSAPSPQTNGDARRTAATRVSQHATSPGRDSHVASLATPQYPHPRHGEVASPSPPQLSAATPPSTAGGSTPARPSYHAALEGNWSSLSPPALGYSHAKQDAGIREISELAAEWRQIESRRAVLSIKEEAQARVLEALKQAGATPSALRKAQEVLNHSSESVMNV